MPGNLVKWILDAADGQLIEAVVIGRPVSPRDTSDLPDHLLNQILSWEAARPLLDFDFGCGFGRPRCNPITAWTKHKVIFVSRYDGATSIQSVPRHPINHEPTMPGG